MLADGLTVLLILMLIGALPLWPYSRSWGYLGAGGVAVLLLAVGALIFNNVI
jgi:low affinity Fe/Cu permease